MSRDYTRNVHVEGVLVDGHPSRVGLHLSGVKLEVSIRNPKQFPSAPVTRYELSLEEAANLLAKYVIARAKRA